MSPAVREKQLSSDGCSILQNYRLAGKPPSTALTLCAIVRTPHLSLWWISSGASCEHNNVAKKTQDIARTEKVVFSHELLLNWNCLTCSALPLVPISALHATQREMGWRKNEIICFHMEIHSEIQPHQIVSAEMVLTIILSLLHALSSAWLSLRLTISISHTSTVYSAMTSSCPLNCILHYSEWLYPIKSVRRAKMGSKIWKRQTKDIFNSYNRYGVIQGKIYDWDCTQSQVSGCSIPISFSAPSNGKPSSSIMVSWLQGLRSHVQTLIRVMKFSSHQDKSAVSLRSFIRFTSIFSIPKWQND